MKEYQSAEEKYFGREAPVGRFLREAGTMTGGMIIGMYTLPTKARKAWNNQTRLQKEKYLSHASKIFGVAGGFVGGAYIDIILAKYTFQEASRDNYIPAIAWGAANIASLTFECGARFGKKWGREQTNLD